MDPTLKARTITRLKTALPGLSPQLQAAAKYVVDNPALFGIDSIRDSAQKAGVSTYSLIRLAERLGFDGFEDFRAPFRHALTSTAPIASIPGWIEEMRAQGNIGQAQADVTLNTLSVVQNSLARQAPETMERAVRMLLAARTVYLTAMRSSYGLAYHFHYVGRMALTTLQLIPQHMNSAIDDLNTAGPEDVLIAITVSPYSRETIEACEFAQERGVKLILVTDSEVMAANFRPEVTLVASTLSTHHFGTFSGVMSVLETLLALLVNMGGPDAAQRISSYEELRKAHNVYWSAKAKQ
ncbi:MurR/RpiR family transcriptional regulator [Marimonas lutisalis]|uniref:MurR/RpiR family transcriptional regulator n=1 Tax=Marimonas lutisalis TaxID=2545756 RepID=UPI0010F77AD7|nr:MurR/RpiR family transcriptional regulator [Marimonas lutisalis]